MASIFQEAERDDLFVLDNDGTSNINTEIPNKPFFAERYNGINNEAPVTDLILDETTKEVGSQSKFLHSGLHSMHAKFQFNFQFYKLV